MTTVVPLSDMDRIEDVELRERTISPTGTHVSHAEAHNIAMHAGKSSDDDLPSLDEDTLFFSDGKRRVDFVLVYQTGSRHLEQKKAARRQNMEQFLMKEGLMFEIDSRPLTGLLNQGLDDLHRKLHESIPVMDRLHGHNDLHVTPVVPMLCFMKIHATWEMLIKYADIMKLKMPLVKGNDKLQQDEFLEYFPNPFRVDRKLLPEMQEELTSYFSQARIDQFEILDKDSFFSPAQRSQLVWECLSRIRYDHNNTVKFGVQRLLANQTYLAAFAPHDGSVEKPKGSPPTNLRAILKDQWGSFSKWYKIQPIEYVKLYFGERVAFYFGWMEYHTVMLIPAAIIGLICFFFGVATYGTDPVTNDVCTNNETGHTVMCPLCDKYCPFWLLKESCHISRATYFFDNPATIFFSAFMALWAMVFLEFWKRRQAVLAWNFDTLDAVNQYEPVRPELGIKAKQYKVNPVTEVMEPYVPTWKRWLHGLLSANVILFMMFVVLAAVFGIVVYRLTVQVALYATGSVFAVTYAAYIVSVTSAFLDLIVILVLEKVYYKIARWLTDQECPRTQTEYEASLTWKYYIFEFVNCYSALVYVAFFKGRVPKGYPGSRGWFNIPVDQCDQAGCIVELSIQIAVLLLGRQAYSITMEAIVPFLLRWWRKGDVLNLFDHAKKTKRWEKDFALRPFPGLAMFKEYTRMVLQFGFITTFGAAFPLAPFFALLCNLFEIRFDAWKILVLFRRPVTQMAKSIGPWKKILRHLAQFSVVTNAFVISFTSDFVPKLVYQLIYSKNGTLDGYVQWSLAQFSVQDFPAEEAPIMKSAAFTSTTICYYRDFRYGPDDSKKYEYNVAFWHILAARLALVLVLEHFILIASKIIGYLVPDIPSSIHAKILRQNFLAREAFFESEARKMHQVRTSKGSLQQVSIYPKVDDSPVTERFEIQ